MKIIKYKFLSGEVNRGTEEQPIIEQIFLNAEVLCPTQAVLDANLPRVQKEAYNGEYTIEDDGESDHVTAPHNILAGEYVTIEGILYKATENIPNGEPIIIGQNTIVTTIEEQLYELMNNKEE